MTTHSHIGASSMHRWMNCPGSVRLSKNLPNISSKYAEEGTLAHDIAGKRLLTGDWPPDCDDEMKEQLQTYIDTVENDQKEMGGGALSVEVSFKLDEVYPGAFGTADAVIYYPKTKFLRVYDLKYGAGVPVEVVNNVQLSYYGLGALYNMKALVDDIELVIVQPRCFHVDGPVRRWRLSPLELLEFSGDVSKYAKATENPNAPLVPGDWCRWCPAKASCPALREESMSLAKREFSEVQTYDSQALGEVLEKLPRIEEWIKGVREFAYREAEHGRPPFGWKLVQKRAYRKWKDSVTVDVLWKTFGIFNEDAVEEPKLKSPAQIEKMLSKEKKEILKQLVVQESSGTTLVMESDTRPAIAAGPQMDFTEISDDIFN